MTEILIAIQRMPDLFSTVYTSSNEYYIDFLRQFNSRRIELGSMHKDRLNYTKDFRTVYRDYKKATIQAKERIREITE